MSKALRVLVLLLIIGVILAWMLWPVVTTARAGAIASANDCMLDEGSIHPCFVDGEDIGPQLYSMGVSGWFMLVTIPTGLAALGVLGLVLLVLWMRRRSRSAKDASERAC
jgi:hypothetical protein